MIAINSSDQDWFFRILEIRKQPESVLKEEVLKMADDLVLFMCSIAAPSLNSKCVESILENCPSSSAQSSNHGS
jgi:hypothetical protein